MSEKQQVKELMMFELRNMKLQNGFLFILFMFFSIIIISSVLIEPGTKWVMDFLILPISLFLHIGVRSKPFYLSFVKGDLYVAPIQVLLKVMPFSMNTIIKARLILFLVINVIVQTTIMLIVYFLAPSDFKELISLPAWLFVWNVLTIVIACVSVMGEAGARYSKKYLWIFNTLSFLVFVTVVWAFNQFIGPGIVSEIFYYTVFHPVIASSIALVILIITIVLTVYYMKHYMRKADYHV
ncbi:hypothetical protein [Alkalicoccobacillus plakortidis]|uniref:Uncharacterized protein n=1 Tax=Alkalicoccobacillus plakortidis TaxID=444060 RepID=A0ABT0XJE1_9BACI|nr:hypothetical protein [Alkalicoccobacillus plakortidis]MCM2676021.1 hypothetical protein [Alkalicoccobacillus plakortidis]